jgi:hypothetical protein
MWEWRYGSTIFILGSRWRRMVNFTPLSLSSPGEQTPVKAVSAVFVTIDHCN